MYFYLRGILGVDFCFQEVGVDFYLILTFQKLEGLKIGVYDLFFFPPKDH